MKKNLIAFFVILIFLGGCDSQEIVEYSDEGEYTIAVGQDLALVEEMVGKFGGKDISANIIDQPEEKVNKEEILKSYLLADNTFIQFEGEAPLYFYNYHIKEMRIGRKGKLYTSDVKRLDDLKDIKVLDLRKHAAPNKAQ